MPDSNYPPHMWRWCEIHRDWDSNGDGMCTRYAMSRRVRPNDMEFCRLVRQGARMSMPVRFVRGVPAVQDAPVILCECEYQESCRSRAREKRSEKTVEKS